MAADISPPAFHEEQQLALQRPPPPPGRRRSARKPLRSVTKALFAGDDGREVASIRLQAVTGKLNAVPESQATNAVSTKSDVGTPPRDRDRKASLKGKSAQEVAAPTVTRGTKVRGSRKHSAAADFGWSDSDSSEENQQSQGPRRSVARTARRSTFKSAKNGGNLQSTLLHRRRRIERESVLTRDPNFSLSLLERTRASRNLDVRDAVATIDPKEKALRIQNLSQGLARRPASSPPPRRDSANGKVAEANKGASKHLRRDSVKVKRLRYQEDANDAKHPRSRRSMAETSRNGRKHSSSDKLTSTAKRRASAATNSGSDTVKTDAHNQSPVLDRVTEYRVVLEDDQRSRQQEASRKEESPQPGIESNQNDKIEAEATRTKEHCGWDVSELDETCFRLQGPRKHLHMSSEWLQSLRQANAAGAFHLDPKRYPQEAQSLRRARDLLKRQVVRNGSPGPGQVDSRDVAFFPRDRINEYFAANTTTEQKLQGLLNDAASIKPVKAALLEVRNKRTRALREEHKQVARLASLARLLARRETQSRGPRERNTTSAPPASRIPVRLKCKSPVPGTCSGVSTVPLKVKQGKASADDKLGMDAAHVAMDTTDPQIVPKTIARFAKIFGTDVLRRVVHMDRDAMKRSLLELVLDNETAGDYRSSSAQHSTGNLQSTKKGIPNSAFALKPGRSSSQEATDRKKRQISEQRHASLNRHGRAAAPIPDPNRVLRPAEIKFQRNSGSASSSSEASSSLGGYQRSQLEYWQILRARLRHDLAIGARGSGERRSPEPETAKGFTALSVGSPPSQEGRRAAEKSRSPKAETTGNGVLGNTHPGIKNMALSGASAGREPVIETLQLSTPKAVRLSPRGAKATIVTRVAEPAVAFYREHAANKISTDI